MYVPSIFREIEALEAEPPPAEPRSVFGTRDTISGLLIGVGVLALVILLLRNQMRKRDKDSFRAVRPRQTLTGDVGLDRLETAMADANELTRTLASSADNRAARLEALIEDADRRIAELERLRGGAVDPTDNGRRSTGDAIAKLHASGADAQAISDELGVPVGEVELHLSLRSRRAVSDRK
ncbi:MAG: hypothetical protein CMJ31_08455 [Phycisphaerae bacterium]|nr:hypothetical protein [Phycisphaerae bacterium]